MRSWRILPAITLLGLALPIAGGAATQSTTIAVLNFDNTSAASAVDDHEWLRKGLADLIINDLATVPALRVMTREQMQMLLQEAHLQSNLLEEVPPDEAEKMRRYFVVDLILRGSYAIEGTTLALHATLLRQSDSAAVARFMEKAPLADALQAQKALARQLIGHLAAATPAEVASWPLPQWTGSITAAQRLYEGVDRFDQGDYLRAWFSFRQARRLDPDYADAAYWIARMHYYRTDYAHARPDYDIFIRRFPGHGRIGDAVMELIHSAERLSDSPAEMLALYQKYQEGDWQGVKVYNQIDHLSHSPLSDWLAKRQQGALTYLQRYDEAYQVLLQNLDDNRATNETGCAGQTQAMDLLATLAMLSEDRGGTRLMSDATPYRDITLSLERPEAHEKLDAFALRGQKYQWGNNYRLLAPEGYRFKTLKAEIWRTNDTNLHSVCRLQVRRYRYVDINTCWTQDKDPTPGKRYLFDVAMPPNATWLLLRPEYDGLSSNPRIRAPHSGRFDAWRVDAEFEPLHPQAGGIELRVRNAMEFNAHVDGSYARCRNGTIGNLAPGTHTLRITAMFERKQWGFEPLETTFEVQPGHYSTLDLDLEISKTSRERGWQRTASVALEYPTYKHSPRRIQNWRDGAPVFAADPATGQRVVVWSHLDDLWLATSTNGAAWSTPVNLPAPVNSAHVELNPRLLRTSAGSYAMLFLSDRGQQRSLALYASTSLDLKNWTRPLLVSADHHTDLAFMQARDGTFIALTIPGDEDAKHFDWRSSRDLVNWSAPRRIPLVSTASAVGLAQDESGLFHLVWWGTFSSKIGYGILYRCVHHMSSPDLLHWNRPTFLPFDKPFVITVSPVVSNHRLWCAIGLVDEQYSGHPRLILLGRHLTQPGAQWEEWELPDGVLSGLASLTVDPCDGQLAFCWSMTDMQLNAGRFSGPVFTMPGTPTISKPTRDRLPPAIPYTLASLFPADPPPASCDARTALALPPVPDTVSLTTNHSLRNDLANGAFAAPTETTVKIPEPLRAFKWEMLLDRPPPSAQLDQLTARNLTATLQRLGAPLDILDSEFAATRERRAFVLRAFQPLPRVFSIGTGRDTPQLGMSLAFCILRRFSEEGEIAIMLTTAETERHYFTSMEPPPAPLGRQLALIAKLGAKSTALSLIANNTTLATWQDRTFADTPHTLHFIQYNGIGEIFLDQQRLAIVPLDHPAQRPLLVIKGHQLNLAVNELDIWELGK